MSTERICAVCKTDCGTSERLKDKKGRYFHKGCYERARKAAMAKQQNASPTAAASPAATPPRTKPMAAPRAVASPFCPNCNAIMGAGDVLCMTCGFNKETGQLAPTLAAVKFDNTAPKRSGGGAAVKMPTGAIGGIFMNPMIIALIVAGLFTVLFAMAFNSIGMQLVYLAAALILSFGVFIWLMIDAFSEGATHGILCLICGIYTLYYVYTVSSSRNLKIAYTVSLFVTAGMYVLNAKAAADDFSDPAYYSEYDYESEDSYDDEEVEYTDPTGTAVDINPGS